MERLSEHRLVYLATPYSKYPGGISVAAREACAVAGSLIRRGVRVYSPIAHTHYIAIYGRLDPHDHAIWIPFDEAMMDVCDAMVIAKMEGWDKSKGIAIEIDIFKKAGKPIYEMEVETLQVIPRFG